MLVAWHCWLTLVQSEYVDDCQMDWYETDETKGHGLAEPDKLSLTCSKVVC